MLPLSYRILTGSLFPKTTSITESTLTISDADQRYIFSPFLIYAKANTLQKLKRGGINALLVLAAYGMTSITNLSLAATTHQVENTSVYRFIIEPQALPNALIELANIANMTIVLPAEDIADYRSKAVVGNYTVLAALQIMLAGTGLQAEISASGALKIVANNVNEETQHSPDLDTQIPAVEEILVTGVFNAYQLASQIKRNNAEITEVITEEDIGKMPDNNIADALQRIPGVQLERHNGVGSVIRIRGFSQNLNLLNGNEFLTGMELYQSNEQNFEGSYETFPIDLLQRVDVYKTPSASHIEGGIGGTVDFITRSGFSLNQPLVIGEFGLTQGTRSEDRHPTALLIFGNNWNDKLAVVASMSFRETNNLTDDVDMYTEQGAFIDYIYESERSILADPDIALDAPLLYPSFSSINSTYQHRQNLGTDIRVEYALTDNQLLDFQWFHLDSEAIEQKQSVLHNTVISNSTVKDLELQQHEGLLSIHSGHFTAFNLSLLSRGEKNNMQSDNVNLHHNIELSDKLRVTNAVQYLHANTRSRVGEIASDKGHVTGVRFTGAPSNNPDIPGGENRSGWNTIIINQVDESKERMFTIDRADNNIPLFSYTDPTWLNQPEYGAFTNHVANGYDNEQKRLSFSSDIEFTPVKGGYLTAIKAGVRTTRNTNQFTKLAYLTDYSRTEGAGSPNIYDSSGDILIPTTYNPSIAPPPDQHNIGIQLPVFYDLCGNGGLIVGATCDIDGDGLDDNQPLGPYGYDTGNVNWGLTLTDARTSSGQRLLDRLYGQYIEDTEKLPNYSPSLTWSEAPDRVRQTHNFYSSGQYQHRIWLPDLNIVTANPERWIDDLSPYSPGEMRVQPLESWEIELDTYALFAEASFSLRDDLISGNTGIRIVHTETEIFTNEVPESIFDVRVSPEVAYSGIPLFYNTNNISTSKTHFLPSLNTTFNVNEQFKIRSNLSKTIAHPRLQDMGQGFVPLDWTFTAASFASADEGNPKLKAYALSQWDLSFENYWDNANYLAFNIFVKDIQSFIQYQSRIENIEIPASSASEEDRTATVSVSRPENIDGGLLKGLEFSLQKFWLSGIGIHFNYSYMDSETEARSLTHHRLPLPGISKETLNVIAMFEGERINMRIAYNRRSDYLSPFNTVNRYTTLTDDQQFLLAEFVEGHDRIDARVSYQISSNLSASADFYNLTRTSYSTYLEFPSNPKLHQETEPSFELSLKYAL